MTRCSRNNTSIVLALLVLCAGAHATARRLLQEGELRNQRVCGTPSNPAPYYNATAGVLGVGYSAVGSPMARSFKCIQGINQWYSASRTFAFESANPFSENALPGETARTSDALGLTALVWNSTVAYGCAFAVCSDAFHTEMMCMFADVAGELPLVLENKADIDRGDRAALADTNAAISTNVQAPLDPCPTPYTSRAGDSLEAVARAYNISAAELMCFNSQIGPLTQIGLGGVPMLIPCPGQAPPTCIEYEFYSLQAPTAMMQTPLDDFSAAARQYNLSVADVCCYNPGYNLTATNTPACSAPPLFNDTASVFMVPSPQEIRDRNCTNWKPTREQLYPDCTDKETVVRVFNEFRRRFFLQDIKWDDNLASQAREYNIRNDLCSNPFAPRVSNSLGVSAFSGSARPTCESINRFWPLYISAANQLSLWGQPANYETGFETLQVAHRFLPRNDTISIGCSQAMCGPYGMGPTCLFGTAEPTPQQNSSSNIAGRRRLLQGPSSSGPPVPDTVAQAASCPTGAVPMPGDTIQSFAARFNVTPQEVVCYANQMRNINNEFSSYWVLGAMVLVPCASANPENVTCPEWQLMTGKCDIKYLVYPADTYASVASMALRVSNATINVTREELCCYNQGMNAVLNNSCSLSNFVGTNVTLPCPSSLAAAGCTSSAIATAQANASSSSSSDLGLILGLAIGLGGGLLLLAAAIAAFLIYRRRNAARKGAAGLSDPFAKGADLDDDLHKGKYEWDNASNLETSNSILMFGKQRTGAMLPVAIKFFKDDETFRHERLFYADHSNPQFFPECYDAKPTCKDHLAYVVMERGDTSLRQWIKTGGHSAAGQRAKAHVKAILADIGEGLRGLHSRGLVHGDVKPENVLFFTRSHRWKLIDFATWSKVDQSSVPSYSLRYSAPEVVSAAVAGKPLAARPAADMWSLGMVMWECLTGEHMLADYKDEEVTAMLTGQSPMPFEDDPSLWQVIKEEPARRLLHALLQRKPNFRWEVTRVMDNAFFREGEDTVMAYRKFQAISEAQGAVLNKLGEVVNKVDMLQPFPVERLQSQPDNAMMIACSLEALSDADAKLLFDGESTQAKEHGANNHGMESAGEHYKLQEKDPLVRLRKLVNEGVLQPTQVPIYESPEPAADMSGGKQIFMLTHGKKYLVRVTLAMCDHTPLSVQSVASLCLTPVTRPDDSVLVAMQPQDSACNEQIVVAFGLWDPAEHQTKAFEETGVEIAVEAALCMYTKTADIPVVVKPVANVMVLATEAEAAKFNTNEPTTLAARWDSCPEALKTTNVGVQFFYEL